MIYGKMSDDHTKKESQSTAITMEMVWADRWTEGLLGTGNKFQTIWKRAPIIDEIFTKASSCKVPSTCWEQAFAFRLTPTEANRKAF